MSNYIMNLETQKLELHFDKSDYMSLSDNLKKEIKSNFLFSAKLGAWVSRAKFPNLWRAEAVAKKLGLENGGKIGEMLTFAEQMEQKAERQKHEQKDMNASLKRHRIEEKRYRSPSTICMAIFLFLLSRISIAVLDVPLQIDAIECLQRMIKVLKNLKNLNIMQNVQQ